MVDWSQIAVAIIGSSLVGFLLTNGLVYYSRPNIDIDVKPIPIGEKPSEEGKDGKPSEKRFNTSIVNKGLSGANNVRITLHYPGGYIMNYRLILEGENASSYVDSQAQGTLVISVPRFAPSGVLLVHTIVIDTPSPYFSERDKVSYRCSEPSSEPMQNFTNCHFNPYGGSYFVSATYDEGGKQISTDYTIDAYRPIENLLPFSILVILVVVVGLITLVSIILYGVIKSGKTLKIDKGLLIKIGIVDVVVIIAILFLFLPSQLGLFEPIIWIPLVIGSVLGLTYVLTSTIVRRQQGMRGRGQQGSTGALSSIR